MKDMPKYKSHKIVSALEIDSCTELPPHPGRPAAVVGHPGYRLVFQDLNYDPHIVTASVVSRYFPQTGDFYVVYDDGYESISPRAPFLAGYTKLEPETKTHPLRGADLPMSLASHAEAIEARSKELYKAPRVSLDDIKDAIASEYSFTAYDAVDAMKMPASEELKVLTVVILVMKNGFSIVGKSAPASPENFNAEYGKELAKQDAIKQLWPLMGFALKDRIHRDHADDAHWDRVTKDDQPAAVEPPVPAPAPAPLNADGTSESGEPAPGAETEAKADPEEPIF